MTSLLRSILVVLALLVVPTHAQFAAGGTTGGKNRVSSGFDTTEFAAATVIELNVAKTKVRMIDTTVTSTSVSRIVAFNLHDPNQLGRYNADGELVSAFDAFRTAEANGSIWRSEGLLHPAQGWGIVTAGQDTVSIWDGLTMAKVLAYNPGANNALQDATPLVTDLAFEDGVWWLTGTGGADVTALDHWADAAYKWDIGGYQLYAARLTSRNAGSGWTTMSSTPAIVNATDYAIAVMRSVFAGLAGVDQLGRQRPYWTVGTDGGPSATIYNVNGALAIYDASDTQDWTALSYVGSGFLGVLSGPTRDNIIWRYSHTSISADAWGQEEIWANTLSGSEDLRWPDATVITGGAALAGASGSGRNSLRFYAASDSGLYLIDGRANDNANGAKQEITSKYTTLFQPGDTQLVFSGPTTADKSVYADANISGDAPTIAASATSPTSHLWTFNGTSDYLEIPDADIYTYAGEGFTVGVWANVTNTSDRVLMAKMDNTTGAEAREWDVSFASGGELQIVIYDESANASLQRYWSTAYALPTAQINFIVGRYDGSAAIGGLSLWVNGVQVDDASGTAGSFTDMENLATPVRLGALEGTGGTIGKFFAGGISGAFLANYAMTPAQMRAEFARGLAAINSPSPDTLYSASQHRVKTDPSTGQFLLMDTARTTSVVEIRDKHGALIDTLVCTTCGRGRDADFTNVPGIDSIAVIFGGTLGFRVVTPDPRVVALAQASWPTHGARYIGSGPAIVDSTGHGDFWTLDDAVAAVNNVGQNFVRVLRGTYPAATV